MLETRFPRLPGDIGNPDGLGFPVLYEVVQGASPKGVVVDQSRELLHPFMMAGQRLVDRGADIITTSCGFLLMFQEELEAALPIPVYTSSLMMLGDLESEYGRSNVGVMTISGASMNREFLNKTGVHSGVPIGSTDPQGEFACSILENRPEFDVETCRKENTGAACDLVNAHPNLRALILECTNMAPYAEEIEKACGLPVFTINSLIRKHAYSD